MENTGGDQTPPPVFPGYTEYTTQDVCCCTTHYIPSIHTTFIGTWELNVFVPVIMAILSLGTYIFALIFVFTEKKTKILIILLFTFLFSMCISCYIRMIVDGPGYYPFYWSSKRSEPPGTFANTSPLIPEEASQGDDQFSGIISNDEQFQWAEKQNKPPRSALIQTARRFVLRPDHLCKWASTWIGKRNQKFFILFNLYSNLYLILFVFCDVKAAVKVSNATNPNNVLLLVMFVIGFVAAALFLMTLSFFISSLYDASKGRTQWELWNNIDPSKYDRGIGSNCEDVFGKCNIWYTWLIPYSPWKGRSNAEISAGYLSYYD